jgi:hypothetical protein
MIAVEPGGLNVERVCALHLGDGSSLYPFGAATLQLQGSLQLIFSVYRPLERADLLFTVRD